MNLAIRSVFKAQSASRPRFPLERRSKCRQEVKERIEALAPGGGFIISTSHNIQGDTRVENILALIEAYEEFSSYR